MTDFLLTINISALVAVFIHYIIASKHEKKQKKPFSLFKQKKEKVISEEEKRAAEILEDISNYNGMEVKR